MNFKIFVALAGSAVLMAAVDGSITQTPSVTVKAALVSSTTQKTSATVKAALVSSTTQKSSATEAPVTTKPASGALSVTTPTTSNKSPITCKVGNCSTGAGCYNKTAFGTNTTCESGESCAVLEVSATKFTMLCQTSTQCKTHEAKGTAACCDANNCIPDLAKAKAKATAKNNGCVGREMNMGLVLAIMTIMLPKMI